MLNQPVDCYNYLQLVVEYKKRRMGQPSIVPTMTILGGGSILFTLVWLRHYQQSQSSVGPPR